MQVILNVENSFNCEEDFKNKKPLDMSIEELNAIRLFGKFNAYNHCLNFKDGWFDADEKTMVISCNLDFDEIDNNQELV